MAHLTDHAHPLVTEDTPRMVHPRNRDIFFFAARLRVWTLGQLQSGTGDSTYVFAEFYL